MKKITAQATGHVKKLKPNFYIKNLLKILILVLIGLEKSKVSDQA